MSDNVSPRWIEVSDSDPSLQYSGTWFLDRDTELLSPRTIGGITGGTAHGTHIGGVSFEYEGTDVALYGQFSKTPSKTSLPITCVVDDAPGSVDDFSAHLPGDTVRLCFREGLGLSSHRMVVNITSDSDAIYWVDNLNYVSAPNANLTGKTSRLTALSSLVHYGNRTLWASSEVEGALFTYNPGAQLEAEFYGTTITMEGFASYMFPSVASNASYKIDDQDEVLFPLTRYEHGYRGLAIDQKRTTLYLFQSQPVPLGQHKVVVAYNGRLNLVPLTFAAFLVSDGLGNNSNVNTLPPLSNGTSTGTPGPSNTPTEPKKNLVPIIAGAVGGAAAILLCVGFLLLYFWLRKKEKPGRLTAEESNDLQHRTRDLMMATQPYTVSPAGDDILSDRNDGSTPQSSKRRLLIQQGQSLSSGSPGPNPPGVSFPPPVPPQPSKRPVQRRHGEQDPQSSGSRQAPVAPILPMRKPPLTPDPSPSSSSQSSSSAPGPSQLPMTKPRLAPNMTTSQPGQSNPALSASTALPMSKPRLAPNTTTNQPSPSASGPTPPSLPMTKPRPPPNTRTLPPPPPGTAPIENIDPTRATPLRHRKAVPPPVPRRPPPSGASRISRSETIVSSLPGYTFI